MSLISAIGSTFKLPQEQGGRDIQQRGVDSQGSPLGKPPEGLESVDEVTNQFYQKWNDLETFSSTMKLQYGVDVTKPNFGSEEGREAHNIYQKALADLYYQGNKMKNSQKMLETAFKAKTSTYGDRVDFGQEVGADVFDPNKVSVRQSDIQDRTDERVRLKLEATNERDRKNRNLKRELAKLKGDAKIEDLAPYENLAKEVAKAFSGAVEWKTEEDGTQTSSLFSGKKYGLGSKASKISGLKREDGKLYLTFESFDMDDIMLTPDVAFDVYTGLAEGGIGSGSGIKMDKARTFLENLEGSFDQYAPEDSSTFIEKADKEYSSFQEKEAVQLLKDEVNKGTESSTLALQDGLVGRYYKGKLISDVKERGWGQKGKAEVIFSDGSPSVLIGGSDERDKLAEELIDEVYKEKVFSVGGKEYKSIEELIALDPENYTAELVNKWIQEGKIKVK